MITKAMVPTGKATGRENCRTEISISVRLESQFQNRLERSPKEMRLNSNNRQDMKNEHRNSQDTLNRLAQLSGRD